MKRKTISILLVLTMLLSFGVKAIGENADTSATLLNNPRSETSAESNPFTIRIEAADNYKITSVANIKVTITNTSGTTIKNVSAEAFFDGLSPVGKSNTLKAEKETLDDGESLSLYYRAMINNDNSHLNFIQKILVFFARLFKRGVLVSDNGFNNGRAYLEEKRSILFGKIDTTNTVRVWFNRITLINEGSDCWFQDVDESHVAKSSTDIEFIDNHLIVMFWSDASEREKQKVFNYIGGMIIGQYKNEYQIETNSTMTLEALRSLCEKIDQMDGVIGSYYESVTSIPSVKDTLLAIPNDPWKDTFQGILGTDWDETSPSGLNWWHETIQTPSAWNYQDRFNEVNIGIVDNGFDTNHEDLEINVINPNENRNEGYGGDKYHGTHVAGIIGATANNNTGITGIVWNKSLYGADVIASKSQNKRHVSILSHKNAFEALLERNCKVINFSIAMNEDHDAEDTCETAIEWLMYWENIFPRNEFIIVQAAGNHHVDSTGVTLFGSITDDRIENYFNNHPNQRGRFDPNDIKNHYLVVGSVDKPSKDQKYTMSSFSSYGDYVSIVAPGRDIFSTIYSGSISGNYGHIDWDSPDYTINGTSMAAPMVTGVASLVWSVNPNFTAKEVKEMVCNCYAKQARGYGTDTHLYPIVNAKCAVEEALCRTVSGRIVDSQTKAPIANAKVNCNGSEYILTNSSGSFNITMPGHNDSFYLEISHNEYDPKNVTITGNNKYNYQVIELETNDLTKKIQFSYEEIIKSDKYKYDSYTIYDIDKNGIPELIVDHGRSESERTNDFYTFNEKATLLCSERVEHTVLYQRANNGSGLLRQMTFMGTRTIELITLLSNSLTSEIIYIESHEPVGNPTFSEPPEPLGEPLVFYDVLNTSSIQAIHIPK